MFYSVFYSIQHILVLTVDYFYIAFCVVGFLYFIQFKCILLNVDFVLFCCIFFRDDLLKRKINVMLVKHFGFLHC